MTNYFHGTGKELSKLTPKKCELGFPAGVWLTDSKTTARTYAERHPGGGIVATVTIDESQIMGIWELEQDCNWDSVKAAKKAKSQGAAAIRVEGLGILVFKTKVSNLQITEWGW